MSENTTKTDIPAVPKSGIKTTRALSVFTLTMINVAAIATLRDLPAMAVYGLSSVFYCVVVALVFMIPISLVSAELATGWPQRGGIYVWARQAFGMPWGFVAIWLQWIQNVVWYPMVLTFAAATLAYLIDPKLASNPYYTVPMVLALYWAATLINFRGMKASGKISAIGVIVGTLAPGVLLILVGIYWLSSGEPTTIRFSASALLPNVSHLSTVVLALGALLTSFVGMEMSASHAEEVKNPKRDFPRAILFSTIIILALAIIGTIALAAIVPPGQVNPLNGFMQAVEKIEATFHLDGLVRVLAIIVTFGLFAQVTTWIPGPSKGLLAVGRHGYLPRFFHRINKNGVQVHILLVQGCIVSLVALLPLFVKMTDAYVLLMSMAAELYLTMYIMMFIAAIRLRYTQPDVQRAYRVPGPNIVMWIVCLTAIGGALFSIGAFYAPPKDADPWIHIGVLLGGWVILGGAPIVIHRFQRPSWQTDDDSHLQPDTFRTNVAAQAKQKASGGQTLGLGGGGVPKGTA